MPEIIPPGVIPFATRILHLFSFLPGEMDAELDVAALTGAVTRVLLDAPDQATIPQEFHLVAEAITADADKIFIGDEWFKALALDLLVAVGATHMPA